MVEISTAKSPGPVPPNQALAITAPKNRKRKGYGNKLWSNSVETKAAATVRKTITHRHTKDRVSTGCGNLASMSFPRFSSRNKAGQVAFLGHTGTNTVSCSRR